jgi:hypothetical protein
MPELSEENQERVNHVLKHNHLIQKFNALLEENGLHDFSVDVLKLKFSGHEDEPVPLDCREGYELQWVCNSGSSCEMKCVPLG